MKKFIQYARLRCAPTLAADAAEQLAGELIAPLVGAVDLAAQVPRWRAASSRRAAVDFPNFECIIADEIIE